MKLTNTRNLKRKSGMTLLELTVVILVLLSLISILFIGARAWKKGSDRAANILNVRNVQQAVRAHANVRGLTTPLTGAGPAVTTTEIFGTASNPGYLKEPTSPTSDITYGEDAYLGTLPAVGTLYMTPEYADGTADQYFYSTAEITAGKIADW